MKNASLIFLALISVYSYSSYAQIKTIAASQPHYESALPTYAKGGMSVFYKYLDKEVLSLMNKESGKNSSFPPTSLKILLYINEKGEITDVGFPDESLSKVCETKMKAKLVALEGWKAPLVDGKPIRSTFLCNISCILWQ
ncbi:hypothetical protein [Pedobacter jeongneungensis]|uniref:hypothetical protein n=1 Tax=Pedobacter jeongneungensis TaxID=947309 RepID=UPI0004687112|nr:hypothetical protein [Pedobacter jeongneungensis]